MHSQTILLFCIFGFFTSIITGMLERNILNLTNSIHKSIYKFMIFQSFFMCAFVRVFLIGLEDYLSIYFTIFPSISLTILKALILELIWYIITLITNVWKTNLATFSLIIYVISSLISKFYI